MKIDMSVKGARELKEALRHTGERVASTARKIMHSSADKIVEVAKIQAPRDKYNLEESIRKEVSYGERGRLQIDIKVGGTVGGVDVDEYAALVHENYNSMIEESEYDKYGKRRREGTKEKQAQYPSYVIGEKFLERAADPYREKLRQRVAEAVTVIVKEETE